MQTKNFSTSDCCLDTTFYVPRRAKKWREVPVFLKLKCCFFIPSLSTPSPPYEDLCFRSPLHLTFLLQSEFLRQTPTNFPSSFLNSHSFSGIHPNERFSFCHWICYLYCQWCQAWIVTISIESRLWFFPCLCMDVRIGLWRKLSVEELMLLNGDVGEDSCESLGLQGDPTSPF